MARLTKQEMWEQILEVYKLRRNIDAAAFFGVTPQTMYSRIKGGIIDFEEIYAKCPKISADWLLSGGEGEILREERGAVTEVTPAPQRVSRDNALALEALRAEQESLKRAQEQISGLIEILRDRQ